MKTKILDGKKVAEEIKAEAAEETRKLAQENLVPGLATVLVGDNPGSHLYVRMKARTSKELGMHSEIVELSTETTTEELLQVIERLNGAEEIDAILVQLPLPDQIDESRILKAVRPDKDVDGFHPENVGRLVSGNVGLAPCTPMGIMYLLEREGVTLKGAEAVVVGRSNIVGKPLAFLLLHQHATVTLCHSRTRDLPAVCRRADILVAAVGQPALVTRDYLKEGVVIIDVGTNRVRKRRGRHSPLWERLEESCPNSREGFYLGGRCSSSRPHRCGQGPDSGPGRRRSADHRSAHDKYRYSVQNATRRTVTPGSRYSAPVCCQLSVVSCQLSVVSCQLLIDLVDEDSVVLFGGDVGETIIE